MAPFRMFASKIYLHDMQWVHRVYENESAEFCQTTLTEGYGEHMLLSEDIC